ncbi:hypothetical protein LEP1GSC172_3687 [Leptospira noguchii]|uniref:Uncharacterized protein n=1 Tax=Leptospira noguchii TaxID=28182 RepID=M6V9L4_9LEPT|nr:hypothetical protein LEP1GSC172_3687 [Leptospira noguchii]
MIPNWLKDILIVSIHFLFKPRKKHDASHGQSTKSKKFQSTSFLNQGRNKARHKLI